MNGFRPTDGSATERGDRSGDRIELLLRATGRRPAVPSDRAARVEAQVKAHWRMEVRRRSGRRRLWAGVALASATAGLVTIAIGLRERGAPTPGPAVAAVVEVVRDSAWSHIPRAGSRGSPSVLRPGDSIAVGSEVATEGHGRTALRLPTGHSVRLDAGTRVQLVSDRVLVLERGAVYVDSRGPAGPATDSVEVRTPFGTLRDIGTQFEVRRLPTSLRVRVREGTIRLTHRGSSLQVRAGGEAQLDERGGITRREMTASGAEWGWAAEIAPMLEIEGRSLQQFLDWVARERGLRLEFASPAVARSVPEIILNGSIEGMSLEEALESVLPTCRMIHRIEGDALIVRPARSFEESS